MSDSVLSLSTPSSFPDISNIGPSVSQGTSSGGGTNSGYTTPPVSDGSSGNDGSSGYIDSSGMMHITVRGASVIGDSTAGNGNGNGAGSVVAGNTAGYEDQPAGTVLANTPSTAPPPNLTPGSGGTGSGGGEGGSSLTSSGFGGSSGSNGASGGGHSNNVAPLQPGQDYVTKDGVHHIYPGGTTTPSTSTPANTAQSPTQAPPTPPVNNALAPQYTTSTTGAQATGGTVYVSPSGAETRVDMSGNTPLPQGVRPNVPAIFGLAGMSPEQEGVPILANAQQPRLPPSALSAMAKGSFNDDLAKQMSDHFAGHDAPNPPNTGPRSFQPPASQPQRNVPFTTTTPHGNTIVGGLSGDFARSPEGQAALGGVASALYGAATALGAAPNPAFEAPAPAPAAPATTDTASANPEATPADTAATPATPGTASVETAKPLLDLIGKTEGTDKGAGYNETLGYGKYTGGPVNLTSMTIGEVKALQKQMLKNGAPSTAVGRYQFLNRTLTSLAKSAGLSDDTVFTADVQDQLALKDLHGRGLDAYMSGSISQEQFMDNLSHEWASLPNSTGKGTYAGQKTGATSEAVQAILTQMSPSDAGASGSQSPQSSPSTASTGTPATKAQGETPASLAKTSGSQRNAPPPDQYIQGDENGEAVI